MDIELCTDSFEGALSAEKYGLKRVELCAALNDGGLTPSLGMIQKCASLKTVEVHVMIRPRAGSFVYLEDELDTMVRDIIASSIAGAKGVVFGCLLRDNRLDLPSTLLLVETALRQKMEITFHRAIDFVEEYEKVLQDLIHMGVNRILTSGGKATAIEGAERIREMIAIADKKIEIMAGSGVNGSNAKPLTALGVDALHFTARKRKANAIDLNMGEEYEPDPDKIASILSQLK